MVFEEYVFDKRNKVALEIISVRWFPMDPVVDHVGRGESFLNVRFALTGESLTGSGSSLSRHNFREQIFPNFNRSALHALRVPKDDKKIRLGKQRKKDKSKNANTISEMFKPKP